MRPQPLGWTGTTKTLGRLWSAGTPENDVDWVVASGHKSLPPRHILLQCLARLLRRSLRQSLHMDSADHLVDYLVEQVQGQLHVPMLLSIFPLLDDASRCDFQQWLRLYPREEGSGCPTRRRAGIELQRPWPLGPGWTWGGIFAPLVFGFELLDILLLVDADGFFFDDAASTDISDF